MVKPTKQHEIQQLAGRVASLSWFVAWLGEKALPFYALMKKSDKKFEWTEEADQVFVQLKKCFPLHQCWSHPMKKNHCYYTFDACKMHPWSLHFTTWYSTLFASYIGYIHAF
jgi:hypothetical protein